MLVDALSGFRFLLLLVLGLLRGLRAVDSTRSAAPRVSQNVGSSSSGWAPARF
jgi:hypothetical protein